MVEHISSSARTGTTITEMKEARSVLSSAHHHRTTHKSLILVLKGEGKGYVGIFYLDLSMDFACPLNMNEGGNINLLQ